MPKPPPRGAPLPREEPPDEMLTLELGSSPPIAAPGFVRGPSTHPTASGLAPAANAAEQAASATSMFTDLDPVGTLVNDLDAAFGAIVESTNGAGRRFRPSESPPPNTSLAELRELFAHLLRTTCGRFATS